jgi:ParB-like chromosome segregation protein Spo0J
MRRFETHIQATKGANTLHPPGVMQIRLASLRTLKPSQRNARTHSKRQIKQIADSISAIGWTYPILVDENGHIVAGNGRFLAASHLGLTEAPVMTITGLTETQKRVLALADNKIAANAGWDRSVLAAELGELAVLLPEIDLDISITGFDPAEVDALAVDFSDTEREPADELPELQSDRAVSQIGDLWTLGEHRLVCGNACEDAAVKQLMGRKLAAMLFGDPPYMCVSAAL